MYVSVWFGVENVPFAKHSNCRPIHGAFCSICACIYYFVQGMYTCMSILFDLFYICSVNQTSQFVGHRVIFVFFLNFFGYSNQCLPYMGNNKLGMLVFMEKKEISKHQWKKVIIRDRYNFYHYSWERSDHWQTIDRCVAFARQNDAASQQCTLHFLLPTS